MSRDLFWMQHALEQARLAQEEGEIPVGAVVVSADQQLLGTGRNSVLNAQDPCAHAEVNAIRCAAQKIQNYRLLNTTLYVTLEPCPMCAGALIHARIHRLVFATRDFKTGAAGSVLNLLHGAPLNHKVLIDEGPMQQECAHLLTDFFRSYR